VEVRIKAAVAQAKTTLVELFGVGPVLAATFLGEVGDIRRFPSKHHFAAHTGTAPWRPPAARSSATGCHEPVTAS
jgi:transposase